MTLSSKALCILSDLKTELGLSGTSEDARLERLIEAASSAITRFCGVPSFHYEAARVDDVKAYGSPIIHSPKTPLLSIGSIVFDPTDTADTVDSDLYRIESDAQGRIYREGGWQSTVWHGQRIVTEQVRGTHSTLYRLTYECGYTTRNQAQATLDGALDGATETAVVVNETIPTRTPQTGTIRILLDSGTYREVSYTSWTSKTFTIPSTDFTDPNDAADGNAVEITSILTLPEDLEDGCLMLTSMRYRWAARNPAVTSERLMSWSASYGGTAGAEGGIPPEVAGQIGSYRRAVFG